MISFIAFSNERDHLTVIYKSIQHNDMFRYLTRVEIDISKCSIQKVFFRKPLTDSRALGLFRLFVRNHQLCLIQTPYFLLFSKSNVMDHKITILVAPLLKNSSCENANSSTFITNLGALDVIQAFFIMTLTLAIVGANFVVIVVINCRRYASFIHPQVCT